MARGTRPQSISADQILDILNKQWLTTKDIQLIGSVGSIKALKIKNAIIEDLEKNKNQYIPNRLVPSEEVINYFNININYLKKIANSKREIKE